ncbi:uncharacterized protein ACN427_012374 isoform 1-T12 [Glossina fuscipes fuscipes]
MRNFILNEKTKSKNKNKKKKSNNNSSLSIYIILIVFLLMFDFIVAATTPMLLYKRKPDDKYERELVAVSSTVIPLKVSEVGYGFAGTPSDGYKQLYLKKLRKKVQHNYNETDSEFTKPDTLITINRKYDANDDSSNYDKVKVKDINIAAEN